MSRTDIMRKYVAFGTHIPASCQYTVYVYTLYISVIQTECSMSVFARVILMNTIIFSFYITYGFKSLVSVWSLSKWLGLKQIENQMQLFSCFDKQYNQKSKRD